MWWAPVVMAQGNVNVSVSLPVKGARFRVDGVEYRHAAAFNWTVGSKHILEFPVGEDGYQYDDLRTTRYLFSNWIDNLNLTLAANAHTVTVTADPRVNNITATMATEVLLTVIFYEGMSVAPATKPSQSPSVCGAPGSPIPAEHRIGVIFVGSICYWNNFQQWVTPDQAGLTPINAYPYPGYVFLGWKAGNSPPDSYLRSFAIPGPTVLYARFSPAKRVNFRTDPPGLRVRVDRGEIRTTEVEPCEPNNLLPPLAPPPIRQPCIGEFDFAPGSTHILGAPSPQLNRYGKSYVFLGFNNGMGQNAIYTTSNEIYPEETLVARFTRGVTTAFATKPSGLKLSIDGRENWPEYYFVYAPDTRVKLAAPVEQTDSKGRRYVFKRWSNGGAISQEITIPSEAVDSGVHIEAEYELLSQVIIRSNTNAGAVEVDGAVCGLPCKLDRPDGIEVRLAAPMATPVNDGVRVEFASWADGAERERTYRLTGAESRVLQVNFRTAYRLNLAADPPEAARFVSDPPSPDRFFPADSVITLHAEETPGFKFRRWDLDLTGTSRMVAVVMTRPQTAIARYDKVPFIAPAGIRNAAAANPEGVVSPGSLISISGDLLAPYREQGPGGPILAQVLAGTTVVASDRILPLLFVSPAQINAQLPRDLGQGEHELRVIRLGQAPVAGKFRVVPSAPGMFFQSHDGRDFAVGSDESGSPLNPGSAVKRGTWVSLLGTGFGAYTLKHPEGFTLPVLPEFPLAQEVEVWAGEMRLETLFAGGAPGQVGVDHVRFRIPLDLPEGSTYLAVKVRIDGRDSNTVLVLVE